MLRLTCDYFLIKLLEDDVVHISYFECKKPGGRLHEDVQQQVLTRGREIIYTGLAGRAILASALAKLFATPKV